jgi:PhnB protein
MKRKKTTKSPSAKRASAKAAGKRGSATRTATARKARKKAAPIPPGYHTVTPYLVCRGAGEALEFYKRAFGAKEKYRMPGPGGEIMHAEFRIGDSMLMIGDENPQMGATAPQTVGGTAVHVFLYVKDVDKAFAQAIGAGATGEMPPTDMFWGDRYAKLTDPFGHKWSMATHIEDVSPREMARRGAEAMAAMGQPPAS